jgi:hypothetical protein
MSFKLIATLIALGIAGIVAFDFVRSYLKATSVGWQRLWDAGRGSATIVWQQLGIVAACLVTASTSLTDWVCGLLNAPGADEAIKSTINSYVGPTSVGVVMVLYIGVTVWARLRTLGRG